MLLSLCFLFHSKIFFNFHLQLAELQDQVNGKETEAAELRNQIDDLQYEVQKVSQRNDKLETSLADAIEQLKTYQQMQQQQVNEGSSQPKPVNVVSTVSQKKVCTQRPFISLNLL